MHDLLVIGVSHHTCPLALRERLAVPEDALEDELENDDEAATG